MVSSPLVAPRLIGRDEEIALLSGLLDDALNWGLGNLALIEGDAGMGKTRLVTVLADRAASRGALALTVQAFEEVRTPYAPLARAVARAIDQTRGTVAEALRSIAGALDAGTRLPKAKRLAAVATAFRRVLRERGVGLFFEDLHWADRATTELAVFLSAELAAERAFIVATSRPGTAFARPPDQLSGGSRHTVSLRSLDAGRITMIVREALRGRGSLDAGQLGRIAELAGGNPLVALELLRDTLACGDDVGSPDPAHPIQRLACLHPTARAIVETASAAGAIDPVFLARLRGCDRSEIEHALERAQRYAIVVLERPSGEWRFVHALTRAAIEAQIPPFRRAQLHREIGEMLERDARTADVAQLAYHWTLAGDPGRTLHYSEAAADRAADVHDYATAMRFLDNALASAPADSIVAARLCEKLADAALIDGEPARARKSIDAALGGYATLGDAAGVARMHLLRSRLRWFEGDHGEALAEAERARDVALSVGPSGGTFRAYVRLAQLHQLAGRHGDARRELAAAEDLLASASPEAAIPFYNARAMLRAGEWETQAVVADYRTALDLAASIGHPELLVSTQNNLALSAFLTGQPDVALPALEASIATSCEFGMRRLGSHQLLSLARLRYCFGDVGAARSALEDALASGDEARRHAIWLAAVGIPIALAAGDRSLLERCAVDDAVERAHATGDTFAIASTVAAHVELLAAQDRASEIAALLARALDALHGDARPLFLCPLVARFGHDSDFARARALLEAPKHDRSRRAERALFDAYVAARRRRSAKVVPLAFEAAGLFAGLHWTIERARALELAGWTENALRIYREAGSHGDVARLESGGRRADPLGGLTPREREVAELVLGGATNRSAADALGLSERTVANLVQSIFNRLGVNSRAGLARHVAEATVRRTENR
jgi:DNA-binding CsgD family transcriptional regulator/tetratricopeptide (TPR) repeat protein